MKYQETNDTNNKQDILHFSLISGTAVAQKCSWAVLLNQSWVFMPSDHCPVYIPQSASEFVHFVFSSLCPPWILSSQILLPSQSQNFSLHSSCFCFPICVFEIQLPDRSMLTQISMITLASRELSNPYGENVK